MAYARFGEHGSDVYLVRTGDHWVCYGCRLREDGEGEVFVQLKAVLPHLMLHMEHEHVVPENAINRILAELSGQKWETDIERVVKMKFGGDCICRAFGCGHPASVHDQLGRCAVCGAKEICWQ
jgi:hypothetical protein